jgi:CheY-like chemotaxis protein
MLRVLVVDDDRTFLACMSAALRQSGCEVACACDGATGERMVVRDAFDAVVCDLVMPEQEGLQTIQNIRMLRPRTAIVAVSGGLSRGAASHVDLLSIASAFGAAASLQKPFQAPELISAVEQAMRVRAHPAPSSLSRSSVVAVTTAGA